MLELLDSNLFFLLVLVVLASTPALIPWLRWRLRLSRPLDPRLKGTVRAHKLRRVSSLLGDVAEGTVDGFQVRIRYIDTQRPGSEDQTWGPASANCKVTITLPSPLPAGLRMSSMSLTQTVLQGLGAQDIEIDDRWIDPALRIRAEQPELAKQLLTTPAVITALRRAVTHTANTLEITSTEICLTRGGINVPDASEVLDITMSLAHALREASEGLWQDIARDMGLSKALVSRRGATLSGTLSGVLVTAHFITDEDGECVTRIEARLAAPLPGGLRIRQRRPDRAAPSTGNPILDMKVEMTTSSPDAARALLAAPSLTGPLMELMDQPGEARILPESVRLSLPGWPLEDLGELLALTAEVAGCLGAAHPGAEPPKRPQQRLETT